MRISSNFFSVQFLSEIVDFHCIIYVGSGAVSWKRHSLHVQYAMSLTFHFDFAVWTYSYINN